MFTHTYTCRRNVHNRKLEFAGGTTLRHGYKTKLLSTILPMQIVLLQILLLPFQLTVIIIMFTIINITCLFVDDTV